MNNPVSNKGKDIVKPTFVSSISLLILAKTPKKVKEISKFFRKIKKLGLKKFYTQTLTVNLDSKVTSSNITMNTLKIKEIFFNLSNKKINSIQKVIISSNNKLKSKINITTKSLFYKQVIISMSNNLSKLFAKNLPFHVININYTFKSIKSNTCVNFIYVDNKEIIISTNNVVSNFDFQKIKKYMKNLLLANNNSITFSKLS